MAAGLIGISLTDPAPLNSDMRRLPFELPVSVHPLDSENHRCLPLPNSFLAAWAKDADRTRIYCHKRSPQYRLDSSEQFIAGTSKQAIPDGDNMPLDGPPATAGHGDWTRTIVDLIGIRPSKPRDWTFAFPDFNSLFTQVTQVTQAIPSAPSSDAPHPGYWVKRLKSMAERFSMPGLAAWKLAATVYCQDFIHLQLSAPLLHSSNCPVSALGKIPGQFIFATALSPSTALLSFPRQADLQSFSCLAKWQQAALVNFFTVASASVAFDFRMRNIDFISAYLGWAAEIDNANGPEILEQLLRRALFSPGPHAPCAVPSGARIPPSSLPTSLPCAPVSPISGRAPSLKPAFN